MDGVVVIVVNDIVVVCFVEFVDMVVVYGLCYDVNVGMMLFYVVY